MPPLAYDPAFAEATEPILAARNATPAAPVHDVETRRNRITSLYWACFQNLPETPDVETQNYTFKSFDGEPRTIIRYWKKSTTNTTQAVFHTHGGGTIQGYAELFAPYLRNQVQETGIPIFTVDYRLAPEHPHPTPEEDCYAGLTWLYEHAAEFGVDKSRIATMGESAGGRLALVMSIMARDRKLSPPLAKQVLIYPMLDDRNTVPNPVLEPLAFWNNDDNITAWTALLGKDVIGTDRVPAYAAPARVQGVEGLPPTYTDVGELDTFRDEDIALAGRIAAANISVELHVYPGLPHAFEVFAPFLEVTKRAMADRMRAYSTL